MFDKFRDLDLITMVIRVVLSMTLGGMLGLERGRKNRPAGFRTYMLVSVGAALVMMTNQYVSDRFGLSDPVRMGAQVVSGIGFLGAGTIITTSRSHVKGITTAAGLWASACIGLAVGIGFYEGALIGGIAILFIMVAMQKLDALIHRRSKGIDVYIEYPSTTSLGLLLETIRELGFKIEDVQVSNTYTGHEQSLSVICSLKCDKRMTQGEMLEKLGRLEDVHYLEGI